MNNDCFNNRRNPHRQDSPCAEVSLKYQYSYLSIDHLKMGLIRSGNTALTPLSDDKELTEYLWPIVREMIKTAVENEQNLVVEGCYIPLDWADDFEKEYENHFDDIIEYANIIEKRVYDDLSPELIRRDNAKVRKECIRYGIEYIYIDEEYRVNIEL